MKWIGVERLLKAKTGWATFQLLGGIMKLVLAVFELLLGLIQCDFSGVQAIGKSVAFLFRVFELPLNVLVVVDQVANGANVEGVV